MGIESVKSIYQSNKHHEKRQYPPTSKKSTGDFQSILNQAIEKRKGNEKI